MEERVLEVLKVGGFNGRFGENDFYMTVKWGLYRIFNIWVLGFYYRKERRKWLLMRMMMKSIKIYFL